MYNSNEQVIRNLYRAAEAKTPDLAAFVAGFTDDGIFVDMASGITFQGPEELQKAVSIMIRAFSDMHRELHHVHIAGDVVVVELSLQGTQDGPFELPGVTIPPTGRRMDAPCCDVFWLENGRVKVFNCYNEAAVILAQLGVLSISTTAPVL